MHSFQYLRYRKKTHFLTKLNLLLILFNSRFIFIRKLINSLHMALVINKQFPTFRLLIYGESPITQHNINKCYVEIDGTGGYTIIQHHELNYDLMVQLTSNDETQVRNALDTVLTHRQFIANELGSILKSDLQSTYWNGSK